MVVKKVLHMNAGDGKTSYANNSGLQKLVIFKTFPVLDETLKSMCSDHDHLLQKPFKIVDLGCSSGPNTLFMISHVMDTIEDLCKKKDFHTLPEFEVFLNDLHDNDFNNLFKLLPNYYEENGKMWGQCFFYGLPGSFYGRLFPNKSLHFAYSSYSIHWLSQIPKGLEKKNKENIYIAMASPPEVFEVYAKQFQKDFSTFLSLRGEEMIGGGRMVLAFIGRSVEDPSSKDDCAFFNLFATTILDMVAEGLVKMDDLHSFNLPVYMPCKQEVEKIIETEGCFTLDKLQIFRVRWDSTFDENHENDADDDQKNPFFDKYKSGKLVSNCFRAFMEPMLVSHFGFEESVINGLFHRYAEKVGDYMSKHESFYFNLVISLSRR